MYLALAFQYENNTNVWSVDIIQVWKAEKQEKLGETDRLFIQICLFIFTSVYLCILFSCIAWIIG